MDVSADFYITCTNETKLYADNTIYQFRTRIEPAIQLPPGKWEVGLARLVMPQIQQMYIPETNFNIHNQTFDGGQLFPSYELSFCSNATFVRSFDGFLEHLAETVKERFSRLNQRLPSFDPLHLAKADIKITKKDGKFSLGDLTFTGPDPKYSFKTQLEVTDGLAVWHGLGFLNVIPNTPMNLPLDATEIASSPYVGSTMALCAPNLVVRELFGDREEPLLELLPYRISSDMEYCIIEPPHPLYKRVIGGYISELQFVLEDIQGQILRLASDKIQLVLHFRPCQETKSQKHF